MANLFFETLVNILSELQEKPQFRVTPIINLNERGGEHIGVFPQVYSFAYIFHVFHQFGILISKILQKEFSNNLTFVLGWAQEGLNILSIPQSLGVFELRILELSWRGWEEVGLTYT